MSLEQDHINRCIQTTQPQLDLINPYKHDKTTQEYLQSVLPVQLYEQVHNNLIDLGNICINELHKWEVLCEQFKPYVIHQDVYGKVIDQIIVGEGWKKQKEYAAKLGIVALAYQQNGEYQRFIQLVRLSIYSPFSGLYGCPLAMTDGAAYVLMKWMQNPTTKDEKTIALVQEAFSNLTTQDPNKFWTSGQWMTEKKGGSDVSAATETIAIYQGDNLYKLYGYKWFSSATDSDISITLARIIDPKTNNHQTPLSMFILRVRKNNSDELNNIKIISLKDKLGTRQLPTAELLLNGTEAYLISTQGKGISNISLMLNVTRMFNAATAIGNLRRMYQIVLDYSSKRVAFGKYLKDLPAHQTLLIQFKLQLDANTLFFLDISLLFSKVQNNTALSDEEQLFRLMVPLLKLYTAKSAMKWASEGVEALGALGYMENSNVPVILRDTQVLTIWEGTTNVLCLDFLRALNVKGKDSLHMLNVYCRHHRKIMMDFISCESKVTDRDLTITHALAKLTNNHNALVSEISQIQNTDKAQRDIRNIAFMVAETYIGQLLLEKFTKNGRENDLINFKLWVEQLKNYTAENYYSDEIIYKKIIKKQIEDVIKDQIKVKL